MMKNTVGIIGIAIGLISVAVPATAATKVFLLGGQSNMSGVGGYDSPLPAPYNVPQRAVKFWSYGPDYVDQYGENNPKVGDGWVDLQGGFGNKPSQFGPEVSFGYRLNQLFPTDEIYLVKYGISSQDLAVHWNPDGTGNIYNMFQARVHAAIADLIAADKSPIIAGMIWMQGDMDANNAYSPTAAVSYATNLTNLIDKVRSDSEFITPNPNMPFVLGRILTEYDTTPPGGNALVRTAQMTVPGQVGNAAWFDTDDLQLAYSGHYGTQGQLDLGILFADTIASVPEPSAIVLAAMALLTLAGRLCWKWKATHA